MNNALRSSKGAATRRTAYSFFLYFVFSKYSRDGHAIKFHHIFTFRRLKKERSAKLFCDHRGARNLGLCFNIYNSFMVRF